MKADSMQVMNELGVGEMEEIQAVKIQQLSSESTATIAGVVHYARRLYLPPCVVQNINLLEKWVSQTLMNRVIYFIPTNSIHLT